MTITTAKQPGARTLKLAPLAAAALLVSAQCRADWKLTPQVELRETYSDNVALLPDNQAQSSWVSEVSPSFNLTEHSSRLDLSANGRFNAYAYSNTDAPNLRNNDSQFDAQGRAKLIENLLYVDGNASTSRQAISAFGTQDNAAYSDNNSAVTHTWRISPYLRHRFGTTADLEVRYARDSVSSGAMGYGASMASTRSANLTSAATSGSNLSWGLSYYHQDLNEQYLGQSSSQSSQANVQYFIVPRFALRASAGYDDYDYPTIAETTGGRSWTVGFNWVPSTRTSVRVDWGRRYFGKTGALDANYRTPHSVWSLTYNDQVTTSRSQFLLPAAFDTAAMLNGLFASAYPDPTLRQQAVQAYIAALGLPATLTDNINFLSNRYERDRHLQGNATFRGSRSGLVLSVFSDRRNALSLQESDSALLGNALSSLNDNVKQVGASASFDYRLSSRTTASAGLYALRSSSIDTDVISNDRNLNLNLSHAFGSKMHGSLELRHTRGDYGIGSGPYHENAIAAVLAVVY